MAKIFKLWTILSLSIAAGGACSRSTEPETSSTVQPAGQNDDSGSPVMAIVDYLGSRFTDPAVLDRYARADLIVLESAYLWGVEVNCGAVAELKRRNPNLRVVGYAPAHTSGTGWGLPSAPDSIPNPYLRDWYQATRPFWTWTTLGDTMMTWPRKVLLQVTNPACRAAMIEIIARWNEAGVNRLDGVFWDFFNDPLWIAPWLDNVEGEPDLDGDGISYFEDPDEQQAYRQSQVLLVQELRARMGEGFLQIFNGGRGTSDSTFAALADGIMYERFPLVGFGGTEQVLRALDPARPNNLFTARHWPRTVNGGPWVLLNSVDRISWIDGAGGLVDYAIADINRPLAMLLDLAVDYHDGGVMGYGWPDVEIDVGRPTAPLRREGDSFWRDFERGRVTLTLTTGSYPLPYDFTIVQDGQIVQSLVWPAHMP